MSAKYANNIVTTLAGAIGTSNTTISVAAGTGANFPALSTTADFFYVTLADAATKALREICKVTNVSGDTLTVQRAQDGTTARSYAVGDIVSLRVIAAQFRDYASLSFGGTFSSPVYGPTPAPGDSSGLLATTAFLSAALSSFTGGAITSFNGRSGAITLTSGDVTSALGYVPVNKAGDTMTGALTAPGLTSSNATGAVNLTNSTAGKTVFLRVNSSGYMEWVDNGYANVNLTLDNSGNVTARAGFTGTFFTVSSAAALKNIKGDLDGADAYKRVMAWLPKIYSLKADPKARQRAGLIVEEAPKEITDGEGHIDLYAALTELGAALQYVAKRVGL